MHYRLIIKTENMYLRPKEHFEIATVESTTAGCLPEVMHQKPLGVGVCNGKYGLIYTQKRTT